LGAEVRAYRLSPVVELVTASAAVNPFKNSCAIKDTLKKKNPVDIQKTDKKIF
tara:strand:- start:160 stop:318 length:159 start_codon:yes stop_codon:yes gene_type:complete